MASSARSALAALPRALRVSPSTKIEPTHLIELYREQLRVANSFSSYNFKEYFVRKTQRQFKDELPRLVDEGFASSKLAPVAKALKSDAVEGEASDSIYAPTSTPKDGGDQVAMSGTEASHAEDKLREWYAEALSDLAVMARAAIVNQMYEAPKLVVEGRGKVMATGGGGAGAEAGYDQFSSLGPSSD